MKLYLTCIKKKKKNHALLLFLSSIKVALADGHVLSERVFGKLKCLPKWLSLLGLQPWGIFLLLIIYEDGEF